MADPKDTERIRKELINVKELLWHEMEAGHLTFMWGKNMFHYEIRYQIFGWAWNRNN